MGRYEVVVRAYITRRSTTHDNRLRPTESPRSFVLVIDHVEEAPTTAALADASAFDSSHVDHRRLGLDHEIEHIIVRSDTGSDSVKRRQHPPPCAWSSPSIRLPEGTRALPRVFAQGCQLSRWSWVPFGRSTERNFTAVGTSSQRPKAEGGKQGVLEEE